jgi:hypothetical protein
VTCCERMVAGTRVARTIDHGRGGSGPTLLTDDGVLVHPGTFLIFRTSVSRAEPPAAARPLCRRRVAHSWPIRFRERSPVNRTDRRRAGCSSRCLHARRRRAGASATSATCR